ncbi:MAG: HigA family addiction module antitoxin [Pseudomonadota bacterium]|nr:HigA family addiction module antitoxin [Pseudomonadota bacterium]
MTAAPVPPTHPGEILVEMWLELLGASIADAAAKLNVSINTLSEIVDGRAGISPEMAVRLELAFGKSAESWLAHQHIYDLRQVRQRRDSLGVTPVPIPLAT